MAHSVHRASPIYTVQYAILAERSSGISLCDIKAILHKVTYSSCPITKLFKPSIGGCVTIRTTGLSFV
jgi:hypothetical protein